MNGTETFSRWLRNAVAAAALVGMAGAAQAATVTFSDIVDGDGSSALFDVSTTTTTGDGDTLQIGLNNFRADGTSSTTVSALDTLSMTITADPGRTITRVIYTEGGTGTTESGVAAATGSLVANGVPINFVTQLFAPNSDSAWTITPGQLGDPGIFIPNRESITVQITNSLFAFAFEPDNIAQIEKTLATLTVQTIPLPPAVWLFGSALMGLVVLARRRLHAVA